MHFSTVFRDFLHFWRDTCLRSNIRSWRNSCGGSFHSRAIFRESSILKSYGHFFVRKCHFTAKKGKKCTFRLYFAHISIFWRDTCLRSNIQSWIDSCGASFHSRRISLVSPILKSCDHFLVQNCELTAEKMPKVHFFGVFRVFFSIFSINI